MDMTWLVGRGYNYKSSFGTDIGGTQGRLHLEKGFSSLYSKQEPFEEIVWFGNASLRICQLLAKCCWICANCYGHAVALTPLCLIQLVGLMM